MDQTVGHGTNDEDDWKMNRKISDRLSLEMDKEMSSISQSCVVTYLKKNSKDHQIL